MKRVLLLGVLVLSLGLLVGCGNTNKDTNSQKEDVKPQTSADASKEDKNADVNKEEKTDQKSEENKENTGVSESDKKEEDKAKEDVKPELKEGKRAGNLAKDVEFELWEDGKTVKLSDFRGEPVVLNFWTSWCPYCVDELPALNEAYNEYKEKGVRVIAVNLSFQDDASAAKKSIENAGVEFTVANDNSGQAASAFGVRGIPASIFIDKDGVIYDNISGAMDKDAFVSFMDAITE